MPAYTTDWGLELPFNGEYPGSWDEPLNNNFTSISQILKQLHINRASNIAPTENIDDGSSWFDLAASLLKIKTPSGFQPVVKHVHNGTMEGVDQINLSTDVLDSEEAKLPGHLLDTPNSNADKLDGYHIYQLASYLTGSGLELENDTKLSIQKIEALETALGGFPSIEFTKVTVDVRGRILNGSKPTTISGLGILDVYTKSEIAAGYAALTHSHADLAPIGHDHDNVYAGIAGNDSLPFSASDPTIPSHVAPVSYILLNFAGINGDQSITFDVANPTNTYHAINKGYADITYAPISHSHSGGDLDFSTAVTTDGANPMLAHLPLFDDDGTLVDSSAIRKAYLDLRMQGDIDQAFLVAKAPDAADGNWEKYALNKLRADELYSQINHDHSMEGYQTENDVNALLQSLGLDYTGIRQGILQYKTDEFGNPNYLTHTGLTIDFSIGVEEVDFCVTAANGFSPSGAPQDEFEAFDEDTLAFYTVPAADGLYYLTLYFDGEFTLLPEVISLEPIYSIAEPVAPATGQYWFDKTKAIFKQWDGLIWTDKPMVVIGTATVSGGSITELVYYEKGTQIDEWKTVTPAELNSTQTTLQGNIDLVDGDLTTLEGTVATIGTDLDTAESNIVTLQTDLDTAESNIATLQTDLGAAEGNIITLQTDVGTLQTDLNTAEGNITTLQTDVGTLQTDLGTAEGNIVGLQARAIKDTITVNLATTDITVIDSYDSTVTFAANYLIVAIDNTTGDTLLADIKLITDGTNVVISDTKTLSNAVDFITFTAALNIANVELSAQCTNANTDLRIVPIKL